MFIALYDESAVNHGHRRIKLCPFGHFLREQYVLKACGAGFCLVTERRFC